MLHGNSKSRHLIPQELIRIKRDGERLDDEEIRAFIEGVTSGQVSNEQIAAMTMAIWFQGLDTGEQTWLTLAIRDSGAALEWPGVDGPVLDKHSTGGVGDMVSFAAAPVVAACGGYVPMISGRGLGHTGGTLDKLESFPGINVTPDVPTFKRWVTQRGLAIVGQTSELAPADQRIYAVRDATATVESMPLIVASILGKKLCEGLDGLVMDIKVGSGAFMSDLDEGRGLADEICRVSESAGLPCTAVLSDMHEPLSWAAGNALEMREIIDYLGGVRRHARFHEVASRVAAEMLVLGGLASDTDKALARVEEVLESGAAAEKFEALIAGQNGPREPLDRLAGVLPSAPLSKPVYPKTGGYVREIDTRALGLTVVALGGGRRGTDDSIDPAVGLAELAGTGDEVGPEQPLAVIHAADDDGFERARDMVLGAYRVADEPPRPAASAILGSHSERPLVKEENDDE